MRTFTAEISTPYGSIFVTEKDDAIIAIDWKKQDGLENSPLLEEAEKQLTAYFAGELKDFDLPLAPKGDEFQQSVCKLISEIPYGETTTYGAIAEKPCHRVLAADGIGGYSGDGGVERKIELLKLEGGFPYLL